ncbi:hypothetical protein HXX76_010627 [Chlamydomonas incerta]|uniref:Endonuclease/exonuclease/phosphatase domain-containing protein n=1 Tax=Chlamydomonas incerta TaxID=51695 RepID=A0A835T0N8_CHLIN|nr:hypothetical protein HXX76_010627 [Chlamydomonas incerta]|eukprot:KAG2429845.1 hypothetical protein HXX76_010627 [Chlamydomonas incerta]
MTWNINCLAPTVKNFELRYKSFRGFLDYWKLDIAAFQEVKLPAAKVTKELACVDGFQSFWATSTAKLGYSGVTTWCRVGPAAAAARAPASGREASVGPGDADAGAGGEAGRGAGGGVAPREAVADNLGGDEQPELDTEGRFVQTDHGAFVLINVYVPNAGEHAAGRPRLGHKLAFLRALRRRLDELSAEGRLVIAVGDFNVAMQPEDVHSVIDYSTAYSAEELCEMRSLAAAYPDVWRTLHPHTPEEGQPAEGAAAVASGAAGGEAEAAGTARPEAAGGEGAASAPAGQATPAASGSSTGAFTVWEERTNARAFNVGCRIDYFFVSPALLPYVESCEILTDRQIPPKWSDHAALLLRLRVRRQAVPAAAAGAATAEAEAGGTEERAEVPRLLLPPPPAAPCAMWLAMEGRFVDRSQRSIKDMFFGGRAKKQPAQAPVRAAAEVSPLPPAAGAKRSAPEPEAGRRAGGGQEKAEAEGGEVPAAADDEESGGRSCKRQAVEAKEEERQPPLADIAAPEPGVGEEAAAGQQGDGLPGAQGGDAARAKPVAQQQADQAGWAESPSGAGCGSSGTGTGSGGGAVGGDGGTASAKASGGSVQVLGGKGPAAGRGGRGRGAAGKEGGRKGAGGRGAGAEPAKGRGIKSFFKAGSS